MIVHYQLMGKGCEAMSVFVGRVLGHKTPRMTQHYAAHLSPGTMAAAVNKFG
jgi:integrase